MKKYALVTVFSSSGIVATKYFEYDKIESKKGSFMFFDADGFLIYVFPILCTVIEISKK